MKILITKPDFVLADSSSKSDLTQSKSSESWQFHVKNAIRELSLLLDRLELTFDDLKNLDTSSNPRNVRAKSEWMDIKAVEKFPVFVPLPFLSRIRRGDPSDPLLRQVLPTPQEDEAVAGYTIDPLMESDANDGPGLLKKYNGRVLLVTTGACAIHCRYCFRRHFPYEESPKSIAQWTERVEQIANDASIEEVILSGGDPLMLVDPRIQQLMDSVERIPHVRRLRIHTRLPIMIPQRVTATLLNMLKQTRLTTVMVIHANHANELDGAVESALKQLIDSGVVLLNQSVLLRGINDDLETLIQLSQRLIDCRVMPYYLHKNDPVAGTAHFEVSVERGVELIQQMRSRLPGYAVPRFVQEIPGEVSKVLLA